MNREFLNCSNVRFFVLFHLKGGLSRLDFDVSGYSSLYALVGGV